MLEETVSPDDLLAAERAFVRTQASMRLDVFGQVVLHLEALGADGAGERTQVQVLHFDVAVAHALQRVRFAAVTEVDFGRRRERRARGGRGRLRDPGDLGRSRRQLVGRRRQGTLGDLPRGLLDLIVGLERDVRFVVLVFIGQLGVGQSPLVPQSVGVLLRLAALALSETSVRLDAS